MHIHEVDVEVRFDLKHKEAPCFPRGSWMRIQVVSYMLARAVQYLGCPHRAPRVSNCDKHTFRFKTLAS